MKIPYTLTVAFVLFLSFAGFAHAVQQEGGGGGGGGGLPPTATLTTSATSIVSGQSATLTWSSARATAGCYGTNFDTAGAISGSVSVTPPSTTTYTVTCDNATGSASASRTVTVTSSPPAPTASLSASPSSITSGQSSTLTWSSTNATSCTGMNLNTGGATNGSASVTPGVTTSYSVSCSGAGGSATSGATVTVSAPSSSTWVLVEDTHVREYGSCPPYPTNTRTGTCPADITAGQSCSLTGAGCRTFYNNGCNEYMQRYCCGSCSSSAVTAVLDANPTSVTSGGVSTLSWSSTGANRCVAQEWPIDENMPVADYFNNISQSISGTDVVRPTATTEYGIFCYSPDFGTGGGSCSPQSATYLPTCNADQEPRDISCPEGYKAVVTEYQPCGHTGNYGGYQSYTQRASCVACSAGSGGGQTGTYDFDIATVAVSSCTPVETYHQWHTGGTQVSFLSDRTYGALDCTTLASGFTYTHWNREIVDLNQGSSGIPVEDPIETNCYYYNNPTGTTAKNPFSDSTGYHWFSSGTSCSSVSSIPELTAGAITPTSATVGTAVSLSTTISNSGTASTGTGFYTLFQRATDASGTGATDIGTHQRTTALTAGASFNAANSYTFSAAGTWYVRACADKNSAGSSGVITESNENNNCGAWTAVIVSAPPAECSDGVSNDSDGLIDCADSGCWATPGNPASCDPNDDNEDPNPPTVTFSCSNPSPCTISPGGTATLTWDTTGYSSCVGSGFSTGGGNPADGSAPVSPVVTTSYGLTCDGAAIPPVTVTVTQPYSYIEATPDRVNQGSQTTVRFSANQVLTSCEVRQNGTRVWGPTVPVPVPGAIATTTLPNITIQKQTTFTIVCDTGAGAATDSVIVNVVPTFQEF